MIGKGEGPIVAGCVTLHRHGKVPALGGGFPPALDREASGIGATRADLPRIEHDVRDAWLAEAPQPLAGSIGRS